MFKLLQEVVLLSDKNLLETVSNYVIKTMEKAKAKDLTDAEAEDIADVLAGLDVLGHARGTFTPEDLKKLGASTNVNSAKSLEGVDSISTVRNSVKAVGRAHGQAAKKTYLSLLKNKSYDDIVTKLQPSVASIHAAALKK